MITDYQLLESEDMGGLEGAVQRAISEGWQPLGGVAVTMDTYEDRKGYTERSWTYTQAVVRYGPTQEPTQ
jgi:hypothetical protein